MPSSWETMLCRAQYSRERETKAWTSLTEVVRIRRLELIHFIQNDNYRSLLILVLTLPLPPTLLGDKIKKQTKNLKTCNCSAVLSKSQWNLFKLWLENNSVKLPELTVWLSIYINGRNKWFREIMSLINFFKLWIIDMVALSGHKTAKLVAKQLHCCD